MAPVRRSSKKHNEETEQQAEGRATQGRKAKVQETTDEAPATAKATLEAAKATLETITAALGNVAAETGAAATLEHPEDPALSALKTTQALLKRPPILKVEDLRAMEPQAIELVEAKRVFAVQREGDRLRCSKITFQNGRLYLHCLLEQPAPPLAAKLQVSEVVPHSPPCLVFMDLAWPGFPRGRVHIRLSKDTPRARQFLLLCTGEMGPSYALSRLFEARRKGKKDEYVTGGDYNKNTGHGKGNLLPDMDPGHRKVTSRAGGVWAQNQLYNSAIFSINTRDNYPNEEEKLFGVVESGLDVVREAVYSNDIKRVVVVDCGVVLWL